MHPLKSYLLEIDETIQDFAARIGISRQSLYRIISGVQNPKPSLARRIVEATGGAVSFDMLYNHQKSGSAQVINFNARADEPLLDHDRIKVVISIVINYLTPQTSAPPPVEAVEIAAEAAVNTYAALSKVTTRQGPARLEQALRPVLEEILKEYGGRPPAGVLDRGANLAAQLYFQTAIRSEQGRP